MKILKKVIFILFFISPPIISGEDLVGTSSGTGILKVSAKAQATCTIIADDMIFGTYSGPEKVKQINVKVRCTTPLSSDVKLVADRGLNSSNEIRRMRNATKNNDYMIYELYIDSGKYLVWNNSNVLSYKILSANTDYSNTVYGKILPYQTITQGAEYTDTVTLSLMFD